MEPELPNPHSTVHLTAEIHLLATEEGGRQGPLISGEWRTVLEVNGEHWSARLTFVGEPSPGESFLANVEFLFHMLLFISRPEHNSQFGKVARKLQVVF